MKVYREARKEELKTYQEAYRESHKEEMKIYKILKNHTEDYQ